LTGRGEQQREREREREKERKPELKGNCIRVSERAR